MHAPHILEIRTHTIDRLLKILTLAVVASIVAFAAYYYIDRRTTPQPTMIDRALQVAEKAVLDDPQDAIARVGVADMYATKDRLDEAIAQYQAAIEIDKNYLPAHRGLGLINLKQQQYAEAEAEFQLIIDTRKDGEFALRDTDLAEAYYFVAQSQIAQGRAEDAMDNLMATIKIDRTDADAWMQLGAAQLLAGQLNEALASEGMATRFAPKFPEAYEIQSQAYLGLGDEQRARYATAMAAYSGGKNEQALKELLAVTQALPDFPDAWTGLGLAYEANGQKAEAADAFRQGLTLNANDLTARGGLDRLGVARP